MQADFTFTHYAILILYVAASLAVGLWFARGQRSAEGYYMAERSAPWWAAAISIISSDITAVSYLGCAALVFTNDLQLLVGTFTLPLAAVFVSVVFVPFLARRKAFTVYEYLERRFGRGVRTMASALFLLTRGSHLAVALFAAALVMSQVMGLSLGWCLVLMGGLTTLYTVLGGMKAVLWTDVVQFFVLVGGVIAVLVGVASQFQWDLAEIWRLASQPVPAGAPWLQGKVETEGHTRIVDLSLNLTHMNLWAIAISSFLQSIGSYGSDQVLVQRYLSAGSQRQMVWSLLGGGLLIVPVNMLLFATGVFLVAYYSHFLGHPGHAWVAELTDANRVMAHFIGHGLPGALGALVLAGLFAGTMSSFSAGLHSLSTATYADFIAPFRARRTDDRRDVQVAKRVTAVWGVAIVAAALLLGGRDTLFAILAKVMSPFSGPLVGIFLLGMLSKRASTLGAWGGTLAGAAATVAVTQFTSVHWLWYYVVGSLGTIGVGWLLSGLSPRPAVEPPATSD
jgi:SSS family transporter